MMTCTVIVQHRSDKWMGWIAEIPGVSSQGASRAELLRNRSSAVAEAVEMNRADARAAAEGPFEKVTIQP